MNKEKLLNYSQSYCKIRIPIGIFFTVFLGAVLLFISYRSKVVFDETKLSSTNGKVISGRIVKYRSVYFPELMVKYNVNDQEYTATTIAYQHSFLSNDSAQKFLDSQLGTDIPVYYENQNPQVLIFFVEEIQYLSRFLRILSILLFVLAGIMFLLKDNPIFCGLTIFSDIMSIFRLV
jgi:hypothetical protein